MQTFPTFDNNDCVGDARRPDEAMVAAITSACAFFRSVPGPKRPSFISVVMSEQATGTRGGSGFCTGAKWIFCLTSGTIQARDVDLLVIAGGSGGVRAAGVAS